MQMDGVREAGKGMESEKDADKYDRQKTCKLIPRGGLSVVHKGYARTLRGYTAMPGVLSEI